MNNNMKDGKKPLSSKVTNPFAQPDDFGNPLAVPADIKADLAAKGLEFRWINATELHKMQGYHKRGWVPYKRSGTMTGTQGMKFGNDPEGLVRRGDCILATKTKEQCDSHRAYNTARASRGKTINAQKAQELRAMLKDSGLKDAKVLEGYEDEE